jgi:hypothetical protein
VSLGLGVTFIRYEGRTLSNDPNSLTYINQPGAAAYLRAGIRFFRINDFDLDLYAASHLPMFKTEDVDSQLTGYYTPSFEAHSARLRLRCARFSLTLINC